MDVTGLHVVHVVCTDAFAGVERYVLNSAVNLTAAGCRVTVIGGAESSMRHPLGEAGVDWLPGSSRGEALRSLRGVSEIGVINTHMTIADLVGVAIGTVRRTPVVSTRHFASRRGGRALSRVVLAAIRPALAGQIAISEYVSHHIEGANTVVRTGVALVDDPPRTREPLVLLVQRLEAEKKTEVALAAWARVRDRGAWRLAVVGDGADREALQELARSLGVAESVDFVGFQSDVAAWLRRASIFIAPTPREGLGLSVIEAMAYALPVVAARGGGHLESVGPVDGAALFDIDDPEDAAAQLMRLMADPAERERYGLALRERQRSAFSVQTQTDSTLRVFTDAAGGRT